MSLEEKETEEEERESALARARENLVLSVIRISHNGESRASPGDSASPYLRDCSTD